VECPESLHVQALFDDELAAIDAARIGRHVEDCTQCRKLLEELGEVRALIRGGAPPERIPAALRVRVMQALEQESAVDLAFTGGGNPPNRPSKTLWIGLLSGAVGGALAASAVFLVLAGNTGKPLIDDVVADHTRSLLSSHLIDVVSTDQHTVKPWFAGRTDVSPVVADFSQQGFRLIGGRADYLDHQRAAVVVYQHGPHFINVFSWAISGRGLPANTTRNGYHLAFWKVGNVGYCAISDTGWGELQTLMRLLQGLE